MTIPELPNLLRKGQKAPLNGATRLKLCFGWNVSNNQCDIDASAFLVTGNGKVPGDDWFVFYSQETSPDGSVHFALDPTHKDREIIEADLTIDSASVDVKGRWGIKALPKDEKLTIRNSEINADSTD
ncbi:MAG: TerD family protein, partial [Oscillospiraceae bacterium]|nr:TerD family protein [Oscillospiraceae bacterium]